MWVLIAWGIILCALFVAIIFKITWVIWVASISFVAFTIIMAYAIVKALGGGVEK